MQFFADGTWAAWTDGSEIWGTGVPTGALMQAGPSEWTPIRRVGNPKEFSLVLQSLLGA